MSPIVHAECFIGIGAFFLRTRICYVAWTLALHASLSHIGISLLTTPNVKTDCAQPSKDVHQFYPTLEARLELQAQLSQLMACLYPALVLAMAICPTFAKAPRCGEINVRSAYLVIIGLQKLFHLALDTPHLHAS
jgi:hypothetical protein